MRLVEKETGKQVSVQTGDVFALEYERTKKSIFGEKVIVDRTTVLEEEIEREMVIDTWAIFEIEEGDEITDRLNLEEGFIGVFGSSKDDND